MIQIAQGNEIPQCSKIPQRVEVGLTPLFQDMGSLCRKKFCLIKGPVVLVAQ